jgi:hypothetical protein
MLLTLAEQCELLAPLAIRAFTPVFDGLWRGPRAQNENKNSAR